jgi:hypothetical protein
LVGKRTKNSLNFIERMPVELLTPILEIGKQFRGNEPSDVEIFISLSTSAVNGDDLVLCTNRSSTLTRKGAEGIGYGQDIGFGIDNPSLSGNSVLV